MALSGSETLDKSSRHVCLDHDASIGRDVTDDLRNPVEARHLLAVERLAAVEGYREAPRTRAHPARTTSPHSSSPSPVRGDTRAAPGSAACNRRRSSWLIISILLYTS